MRKLSDKTYLSEDNSFSEFVVDWYSGVFKELLPNGADRNNIDGETTIPDILGRVHRRVVGRLDEDGQVVGEEDVVEETSEHRPDNVHEAAGETKKSEVSRDSEPRGGNNITS